MYYTGFTIVAGFSILILSNFIPTIYFGLLTSLAMCLALTGALTLLPQLLIVFKPLKEEARSLTNNSLHKLLESILKRQWRLSSNAREVSARLDSESISVPEQDSEVRRSGIS